ncbi:DUF928 domain-containing protein [Oscillatoriales cyanobacterium LEGE 11467]|uniref:DUF928 domain-containing protein n=1 Tax=Zarconia navalis LEGE 11467 TaxID=1828826 RepID=A0A928VWA4_9CYAN|nr:DUF928 domain-containing protein [Zarconia navalis]MBE9039421.1 DUF928 domain-containing protein [Zarconia navalis LEGE 11467]
MKRGLAIGTALSLILITPGHAGANRNNSDDLPPNTGGRSGGSRGCSYQSAVNSSVPALVLLAPARSRSQTISTRPTFAWFVRDRESLPMEFRLYEYDPVSSDAKLVAEILDENFKSAPGIMTLSLSETMPQLAVGRKYLWQVELVCDRHRPSGNPFADAEIEVVAPSPALDDRLERAKNELDRVALYEEKDLWYDALAAVLRDSSDSQLENWRSTLLDRVAQGEAESEQFQQSHIHRIQR